MIHEEDTPAFVRTSGARAEKLTVVPPLTIRQTESMARDIAGLADLHGMEKSEYIRHLVAQDKLKQHGIWLARNQLFVHESADATNTAHDSAGREA